MLPPKKRSKEMNILMGFINVFRKVWKDDEAQDIAEYAVMLAVILVIVVGTIRLIGSNANNVFSETASAIGG
jgi:Flp pilus assembly pilin Flp